MVKATAILFKEPGTVISSRSGSDKTSCHNEFTGTVLPQGKLMQQFKSVSNAWYKITKPISILKSKVYQDLGLSCLNPKFWNPFQPIVEKLNRKLGRDEDKEKCYIKTSSCCFNTCGESSVENQLITHDRGLPNMDYLIKGKISTYDQCFPDIEKITYAGRVRIVVVDDVSCEYPHFQNVCQETISQNRVLYEEDCISYK